MSDGMNAEEIKLIWKNARDTNFGEIKKLEGDPDHVRRLYKPGGAIELIELPPNPRSIDLLRIEDLIAQANKPFDTRMEADTKKRLITVGSKSVTIWFNTETCREYCRVPLVLTDEYGFFAQRVESPMIAVAEFRTALKYALRSTFGDEKLIEQIGDISFGNNTGQSQAASRVTESLGKTIMVEANSEADAGLPDERVTFSVRMWDNEDLDMRMPIECHLDPDPGSQRWICYPIRESLNSFHAKNMTAVMARIAQDVKDIPIVQGNLI